MVKKTQAAKNALHVSKNYAYLKPSTLRSMAKEISGTRLEACKSYAVSRLPKIAVTATLASLLVVLVCQLIKLGLMVLIFLMVAIGMRIAILLQRRRGMWILN